MKKYQELPRGPYLFVFILILISFFVFKSIERKHERISNNKENIAVAQAILRGDKVSFESVCWVRDYLSMSSSYEKALLNAGVTENDIFLLKKRDVCVKFSTKWKGE